MSPQLNHRKSVDDFARSHEPIVWSLFGAGGMVVAFISPWLIVITGLLLPLGLVSEDVLAYQRVLEFVQSWWGKLFLLVVISLQLYHAVHRIHHGLHDLHIEGPPVIMATLFYGGATLLSLMLAVLLVTV